MTNLAPRNAEQTAEFLRMAHEGPLKWSRMCLSLQRQARGLPGVYPTALAAAVATPESERVYKVADLRRGMVAFSDDPGDSNTAGHIYFIVGWKGPRTDPSNCLTWTNDALRSGGVDIVPLTFYRERWGDGFQFGATWLNGYDFSDFNKPPQQTRGATLGDNYMHAIEDLEKALRHHENKGNENIARALRRDLARMRDKVDRFGV